MFVIVKCFKIEYPDYHCPLIPFGSNALSIFFKADNILLSPQTTFPSPFSVQKTPSTHICIFFRILHICIIYTIPQLKSSQVISGKCQDNRLPFDSSQDGKGLHLNFCFRFQEKVLLTKVCVSSTKIKQRCQHIKFKTRIQTEQHHQAPTQV